MNRPTMKENSSTEMFWDLMQEHCPLSDEELEGVFVARNTMPKFRPKAKTNLRMKEKNKIHSDLDYRFLRVTNLAVQAINIHEKAPLNRLVAEDRNIMPIKNAYRCGMYMQMFYLIPWKEYSWVFPFPYLRNAPRIRHLTALFQDPNFLKGRRDAVKAHRKVFDAPKKDILPSFDTLSDYGILTSQYLPRS